MQAAVDKTVETTATPAPAEITGGQIVAKMLKQATPAGVDMRLLTSKTARTGTLLWGWSGATLTASGQRPGWSGNDPMGGGVFAGTHRGS